MNISFLVIWYVFTFSTGGNPETTYRMEHAAVVESCEEALKEMNATVMQFQKNNPQYVNRSGRGLCELEMRPK